MRVVMQLAVALQRCADVELQGLASWRQHQGVSRFQSYKNKPEIAASASQLPFLHSCLVFRLFCVSKACFSRSLPRFPLSARSATYSPTCYWTSLILVFTSRLRQLHIPLDVASARSLAPPASELLFPPAEIQITRNLYQLEFSQRCLTSPLALSRPPLTLLAPWLMRPCFSA